MNYQETTNKINGKDYYLIWRIEFWQIEGEPVRVLVFDIEKTKSRNLIEHQSELKADQYELANVFL